MSFEDELKKEAANIIKAQEEIAKITAIDLFSGVILRTPVGNPSLWESPNSAPPGYTGGQARSNWFLTFTVPSTQVTDSTDRGDGDKGSFEIEIASKINSQRGNKNASKYILTNNLPYIERLNEKWSTQAPSGIIDPEMSRVDNLIPQIERTVNKRYGVN